jgi:hypothetical protein
MIELQVQLDSRREVVVQVQLAEMAVLGPVTGQPVKLIVVSREIPHGQTPRPRGGYQTAGAAMAADGMLGNGVIDVPDNNAIVVQGGAIGKQSPKFLLQMRAVAVHEQIAKMQAVCRPFGFVRRSAQDDGAIGVVAQAQNRLRPGAAQRLAVLPQDNRLMDKISPHGRP